MAIKIFIDQGHNPSGYFNSGAEANGLTESEINYQVGIYLQNLLNSDSIFEARVSRPTPTTVLGTNNATSLAERVRMANEWPIVGGELFHTLLFSLFTLLQTLTVPYKSSCLLYDGNALSKP